ncbi:MAG: AbgT family transporter [Corynebacterium sp.]|nr:AbgT family transporter [Corynebacterium sp.]
MSTTKDTQAAPTKADSNKKNSPGGFLGVVEKIGNRLPDPFWLFVILGATVLVFSWIGSRIGVSAEDPATGENIEVTNLLTAEGIQQIFSDAVTNFTSFPPLGVIITVMLGVAVAEHAGLISALVRAMVSKVSAPMLTFAVAIAGVTGSIASDAVYVILIPIGAMSFHALGRSPIVGAMVAFAASSAGFNASLILNITDVLLGGISTSAAQFVNPDYEVSPLANYFFVIASTIVLSLIITAVTEFFVKDKARQLVDHDDLDTSQLQFQKVEDGTADAPAEDPKDTSGDNANSKEPNENPPVTREDLQLSATESRALAITGWATLAYLAAYFALLFIPASPLYSDEGAMESPLIRAVAVPIALMFFTLGLVYGVAAGTIKAAADVPEFMARGIKTLVPMIVLFFAVSQFLAWFQWSNIGILTAIKGSDLLQRWDLPNIVLFAALVLMVAGLNLLITSGSAQWALMAPVVVPMMMYVGIAPEVTQMLFRIGDSPTNIITPMSPYFALALMFLQRYYKRAGVGTLMSLALPYSIAMLVGWFAFFVLWYWIGIPLGPGTPYEYAF